jgi:hypothetical protein
MLAEVSAPDLRNLLANALIFVDTSKEGLEPLDGVLLTEVKGNLSAVATDRYRLAEILATSTYLDEGFNLFVTRAQAKQILEYIKPELKRLPSHVRIHHDGAADRFTISTPWTQGPDLVMDAAENRFPKARNLFPANPFSTVAKHNMAEFSVEYLASFGKVKDYRPSPEKNETMLVIPSSSQKKAMIILRGDWFRGMLMIKTGGLPVAETYPQGRFG